MGKRKATDEEDELVTASWAKDRYGVSDEDLAGLSPPADMPGSHAPVQGYLLREVEARMNEEAVKYELSRRPAAELAKENADAARERERQAREAAVERLQALGGGKARAQDKYSASPLPEEVLAAVFDRLVAGLEPGGVWGPGLVAQQLANASMVCWDWYHAAKEAFTDLADAIDQRLGQVAPSYAQLCQHDEGQAAAPWARIPAGLGWGFWDALVSAPAGLKLTQLREAANAIGVGAGGTKPQLILRLLGALGLANPTPAPARLLQSLPAAAAPPLLQEPPPLQEQP
ncbi:hypothetical protein Rsub_09025 [Raphidocelis subcapitata]|uniref:SAP domain-containing protein n=1 Tax=Raphidocelis subcapitata TaxID=307507 RepID=A0A2V0PIR6_9CHLO|nr:hypothetical protein Rsub_09025 [Raphidocelis subcapitata]|eukprot:GBF96945.1 hypothetical protein Rsub_09025 [Raphidocelis subcapitata]